MEKSLVLERYPAYRMDIGIEVHVQLNTKSKIFCSCSNALTDKQNDYICQICAGYPGVLPVLNQQVIEFAIKAGLGTNCTVSEISEFDRKHYFYPDLPKNYQITQNYFFEVNPEVFDFLSRSEFNSILAIEQRFNCTLTLVSKETIQRHEFRLKEK